MTMSDNEINVSQLNKTFGLTDAEREEFRVFIKVLEGVMERHGRDDHDRGRLALSPCHAGSQTIDGGRLTPFTASRRLAGGRVARVGMPVSEHRNAITGV